MVRHTAFPGRELYGERPVDVALSDDRLVPSPVSRAVNIQTCLNEHCGMRAKEFALLAISQDGKIETVLSQSLKPFRHHVFPPHMIRDLEQENRLVGREGSFMPPVHQFEGFLGGYNDLDSGRSDLRRQSSSNGSPTRAMGYRSRGHLNFGQDDHFAGVQARKRQRGVDDVPIPGQRKRPLRIGDCEAVYAFYEQRFKDMQQAACKVIAKAFVKLVEPKKQTNHPYTGGEAKAPKWWPKGTVKHKEPDHLLKNERIFLLIHILRHVMNPPPPGESKPVDIRKLEEVTNEAMSNWFTDAEHPSNASKRPYMREIFQVAIQEERLLNGNIDADATVPVMVGDSRIGVDISDDEPEEMAKYDEHDNSQTMNAISQGMATPESLVSPSNMQTRAMEAQNPPAYGFGRDVPVRGFSSQILPHPMEDPSSYPDTSTMQLGNGGVFGMRQRNTYEPHVQQASPLLHESNRRPTWPQSSPGYPSPNSTSSNSVFSNSWQPHSTSIMPPNQAPYSSLSATPLTNPPSSGSFLPPLPPITQPMGAHQQQFDNLASRPYESTTTLVRAGSIGQTTTGYPEYLQGNCFPGHDNDVKDGQMSN